MVDDRAWRDEKDRFACCLWFVVRVTKGSSPDELVQGDLEDPLLPNRLDVAPVGGKC